MEKLIAIALVKKGIILGLLVGIMKIMKDMREGNLKLKTAIPDLFGSIFMGHISYEIVEPMENISEWFKIVWTVYMAVNAFVIISALQDKRIFDAIVNRYLNKM